MKSLSIRQKLILIIVSTALVTLLGGFSLEIFQSVQLLKSNKEKEANVIASVIADYSASPLAFDDQDGGREVLESAYGIPGVEEAILYDIDGNVFTMISGNDEASSKSKPKLDGSLQGFSKHGLEFVKSVQHNDEPYGTLYIRFNTKELEKLIYNYIFKVSIILAAVLVLCFALAWRLERIVSLPILKLTKEARRISKEGDYKIRVSSSSDDEIGLLYNAFNDMLEQIETRQSALEDTVNNLDEAVSNLTTSNEQLERFAFICSHDLQEPVRMVRSFSQLLERELDGQLNEKGRKYLDFISDGAANAHELITGILAFCRLGQDAGTMEEISLASVCENVEKNIYATLEEKGAAFEWDKNLPTVNGVKSKCFQVFLNLVSNGLKFNRSEVPTVRVSSEDKGEFWRIRVKDNGIGIAPKYHDQIFEIFKRVNNRNEFAGTGLGLSICKKILEGFGAQIRLESEAGEGCTFIIDWPKDLNKRLSSNDDEDEK